jgi:hypothetical protein
MPPCPHSGSKAEFETAHSSPQPTSLRHFFEGAAMALVTLGILLALTFVLVRIALWLNQAGIIRDPWPLLKAL